VKYLQFNVLSLLQIRQINECFLSVFVDMFHAFVEYASAVMASAARNVNFLQLLFNCACLKTKIDRFASIIYIFNQLISHLLYMHIHLEISMFDIESFNRANDIVICSPKNARYCAIIYLN